MLVVYHAVYQRSCVWNDIMTSKLISPICCQSNHFRIQFTHQTTLSEGNPMDAPWQTNSPKRINNRTILPICKVNNKNPDNISLHNPYEILYAREVVYEGLTKNYLTNHCLIVDVVLNTLMMLRLWI